MKLSNLKFWHSEPVETQAAVETEQNLKDAVPSKVVHLPVGSPLDNPVGLGVALQGSNDSEDAPRAEGKAVSGPMASPKIHTFFSQHFYGLGRHNGTHFKTQEAYQNGRASLISRFQNALELVIDEKQAKVDRLKNVELQTEGISETVTAQLKLACDRLERDIESLKAQIGLASEGKGWILAGLNEYQIGFGKGVREAIDAEFLGL
jgi:hypothetical protein